MTKHVSKKVLKESWKESIVLFFEKNKRIPTMREADPEVVRSALVVFGTWNKFIKKCGFKPNKKGRKKVECVDGHIVDSASEAIVDNFLSKNLICHQTHVRYPNSRLISDFYLTEFNVYVEFFGMPTRKKYKIRMERKKLFFKKKEIKVVLLLPEDIFDEKILTEKFKEFMCRSSQFTKLEE